MDEENKRKEKVANSHPNESPPEPSVPSRQEELIKELEQSQKEHLYLRAEFENYKKRIQREQDQAIRFANEKFIRELVEINDHFERALATVGNFTAKVNSNELGPFVSGIELTFREFTQCLRRFGLEFMGEANVKFDPAQHEAISQKPIDGLKEPMVQEVISKGCFLHGRLLKPARVVVGVPKITADSDKTGHG